MTRSIAVRSDIETAAPVAIVDFANDGYRWRVARDHHEAVTTADLDWFNLEHREDAVLVKRNSRRDVWRISCGGNTYFAKLYHASDLLMKTKLLFRGSSATREWDVGHYAAEHGISTVVPVATATRRMRGVGGPSLLITEAVSHVEPLNDYWLQIEQDRHRAKLLVESLAQLIARAHQCGFQHDDMHPGNILIRKVGHSGEALFVDLHNVRIAASVSLREVVANLAQLNQWFRRHASLTMRRRFLKHYLEYRDRYAQASPHARNFRIDPRDLVRDLTVRAETHANRLWSKRDRRTRRNGRYFTRVRPAPGWRGHVLLQCKHPTPTAQASLLTYTREQWMDWLKAPLAWVDADRHEVVKDSHTATICRAELPTASGPASVVVKRAKARNLGKRIGQMFGPSRAMRSWRMANMLINRDLPAAQPLAVIEKWFGLLRLDSVSMTDWVSGSVDLETFLTRDLVKLPKREQRRVKDCLVESIVVLLRAFHDRGFRHRDLKAPNLLINWNPPYDGSPALTFVDMDGISHGSQTNEAHRRRALMRLCASLIGGPGCTRTDCLRFLKRQLTGFGSTPKQWKTHWRELEALVTNKQRTKESRRQWKLEHYGRE